MGGKAYHYPVPTSLVNDYTFWRRGIAISN